MIQLSTRSLNSRSAAAADGQSSPSQGAAVEVSRVLFYLFFPGSGIARYTHELLGQIAQNESVTVELACLPTYHWRHAAHYRIWPELREIGHANRWRRRLRFLAGQFVNPRRALQHAFDTHADILHLSNINHLTFPVWSRMLRGRRLRIAATVHDVRRGRAMLNRSYEDRQLRRFYERADALFVHSRSQAADLMDFACVDPARIHVVPHGPYDYGPPTAATAALRERLGWPSDKRVALFFGNVRDEKNLDLMLRVLPRFRDELHLIVAGSANVPGHQGMAYYRNLADSLGVSGSVTFLGGYIPDPEVADLFEACDWVAMPYSRTFTSQSGVLNVAMTCRRPVLAARAPTLEETLEGRNLGVLIDSDDLDALSAGIQRLHAQLAEKHSYDIEDYLVRHSWAENARRTIAVYQSLIQRDS